MAAVRGVRAKPIGREPELALLHGFLASGHGSRTLALVGGPGIGKTTLWEAGIAEAEERGIRVLSTRASGAEAQLSFAALIDLLDRVEEDELAGLPGPQLRALEVALVRAEPDGEPPEPRAIALGFLNALRAVAARGPLLVAIDDAQWLDSPSADVLAFSARRLEDDAIGFLLAERPGSASRFEQALERGGIERLEIDPLNLGAIRHLLSERLGLSLPRQLLRQIVDSTLGNPLFAIELGRTLAREGLPAAGEALPMPEKLEGMLGTRVAHLPGPTRELLLAVSLSADLTTSQLRQIVDTAVVEDALHAGLVLVEGERVRVSHPLLAAAARKHARLDAQRDLHARLAEVIGDDELRAWHLALATERPDGDLATMVATAAGRTSARGAAPEAVELARHALRLTPTEAGERSERLLALGGYMDVAGEQGELVQLLAPEIDSLPAGEARAKACMLVCEGLKGFDEAKPFYDRALAESESDPKLHAVILAQILSDRAVVGVERIREAEESALEALPAARSAGPEVERDMLYALGWARSLRGRPIDEICQRFLAVSETASFIAGSPERVAGQRLVWRGELVSARAVFTRLASMADEHGEPLSYALQRLHLCELELRIGNWEAAERLLGEWTDSADDELMLPPMYNRCRALLATGRGFPREAEHWAAEAIAIAEKAGIRWDWLEALRARGVAALFAHDPALAVESLRAIWEHTEREGVEEPGVFPVAPELVEALLQYGELDEAGAVTERLTHLANQQEHPWALATAGRCGAVIELASGFDDGAADALARAADGYARLGLRFDRARSLLALGRAQRRHRKWGSARQSLEQATAAFEEIGSPGWADQARAEVARIGARRPRAAGELTRSEQRVAELAAEGLANKEIAQTLVVTVRTVEEHLSNAYAKLGIRSRVQLARRLKD